MRKIIMLSVAFVTLWNVSCSDNENEATNDNNEKKLVSKIIYQPTNDKSPKVETEFKYDSKGNVSEVTQTWTDNTLPSTFLYFIKREEKKITLTDTCLETQFTNTTKFTINNAGYVIKEESATDTTIFSYDAINQLQKKYNANTICEYTWVQGNIANKKETQVSNEHSPSVTSYEYYTEYINNINIDILLENPGAFYLDSDFGKTNKNFRKSITYDGYDKYEYEYEYTGDFISTVKEYNTYKGGEKKLTRILNIYYK